MWSEARAKVSHRLAMHLQRRYLSAAQCHANGQLHLRRPAEERGDHRRRHAGSARRARHVLCIRRPGRCHNAANGRPVTPATSCRCIAAATRSAATPSRTSAPATSTRLARRRNRAQSRIFPSLDPAIEIETFAYPFGYGSFARKQQLKSKFQTCRSIVPGVNAGSVDLQFLRAVPLIDRADESRPHRPRIRRGAKPITDG